MTPKGFGQSSWKHGAAVDWVGKRGKWQVETGPGSQELASEHISSEMLSRLRIREIK